MYSPMNPKKSIRKPFNERIKKIIDVHPGIFLDTSQVIIDKIESVKQTNDKTSPKSDIILNGRALVDRIESTASENILVKLYLL